MATDDRFPCLDQMIDLRQTLAVLALRFPWADIEMAEAIKAVKPADFERVHVDTTVQEKAIAHPTDSRLPMASTSCRSDTTPHSPTSPA